jgi:hypothetical protein
MSSARRVAVATATLLVCAACSAEREAAPAGPPTATPAPIEVNDSAGSPSAESTSMPNTATPQPSDSPTSTSSSAELPRGGREVFPRYRLIGYAGLTGASTLGRLGTGPLDSRVRELESRAQAYAANGREILPVLEVITTVVQGSPGRDGKYRVRISDEEIETYYTAARKHKALLLLNIQPGQSEFLPEAKAYEKWLKQPDIGVALDPEWAMDPGQRPGGLYGHTTGAELNEVAKYLAGLVEKYDLPEKVMVYHQVAASVVRKEWGLKQHDGVVLIKSVDGLGPPGPKKTTYRVVNRTTPKFVHAGFKLFFTEDREGGGRLMSPKEVLALKPRPEYVMHE